jgi:hypothetical protein
MTIINVSLTNDGHNLIRNSADGTDIFKIKYFALGSGTATPSSGDHKLGSETFRKAVTSFVNGGAVGEILIDVYVAPGDAVNFDVEEVGVFGGNAAISAANSGVLIARGLYVHNPKTNLESIQLQLDLTV